MDIARILCLFLARSKPAGRFGPGSDSPNRRGATTDVPVSLKANPSMWAVRVGAAMAGITVKHDADKVKVRAESGTLAISDGMELEYGAPTMSAQIFVLNTHLKCPAGEPDRGHLGISILPESIANKSIGSGGVAGPVVGVVMRT